MTTASFKLMPFPVSVAKSMAEGVFDRNGNGVLDPGDRILFSTFHRDVDGPLPPAFFDITSSNLADFSEMLISPRGFWLKRVHRKFGEASGRVHYWYAVENGRILIDQVQTLVMSPDGTCMSRVEGPKAREKRLCSEFERALFRPDAEDKIKFINERLLIDRHIQAVAELNRLQSEMTWLNITEGRVLDFDSAYRGYSFLFSHDGIEMLDAIIGGLER
nr:hypothetical protein [bacterium]